MPKSLLSPNVKAALDDAVKSELFASHLYRHVANQLQRLGYFGAQKFFAGESDDELKHYQLHADYQNDRGDVATIPDLPAVRAPIKSLRDAIELGYATEKGLGDKYASAYSQCASDPMTQQFLLQFDKVCFFADMDEFNVHHFGEITKKRLGSVLGLVLGLVFLLV